MRPPEHEERYRGSEAVARLATARVCVCGAGADVAVRFLLTGAREDSSVTLKDLRIDLEDGA